MQAMESQRFRSVPLVAESSQPSLNRHQGERDPAAALQLLTPVCVRSELRHFVSQPTTLVALQDSLLALWPFDVLQPGWISSLSASLVCSPVWVLPWIPPLRFPPQALPHESSARLPAHSQLKTLCWTARAQRLSAYPQREPPHSVEHFRYVRNLPCAEGISELEKCLQQSALQQRRARSISFRCRWKPFLLDGAGYASRWSSADAQRVLRQCESHSPSMSPAPVYCAP